ncbi:MAG TPA: hypothetical protein VHC63_04960 [Acidimicrobiales bacterium]|nr:hypothetical protein [Acidimicrobiales bacterium]
MTTTTGDITVDTERDRRLARAISSLRTRTQATDAARVLLIIGSIAAPLGLVMIVLGWWGASHTPNVYEQIPYSISGGMLGLGFVFAGGFAYFAYWMTQLVHATRRDTAETRAVLERIEELLARGERPDLVAPVAYVTTSRGTLYHRPDCASVKGRTGLKRVDPATTTLKPCGMCNP